MLSAESVIKQAPQAGKTRLGEPMVLREGALIRRDQFEYQADRLASRLPHARHVINLCQDRHRFAVGFMAAIRRGQTVLLPPDRSPWMLQQMVEDFPDVYCLVDQAGHDAELNPFFLELEPTTGPRDISLQQAIEIPDDRVVAIPFTSGSTGQPEPHRKVWGHFRESARLIAGAIGLKPGVTIIATVPPQHMYGLEFSVLLPIFCGAVMEAGRPFFPQDVRDSLASAPEPALLVTTPVHLRALLESSICPPPIAGIVSATAPLPEALAVEAERRFSVPLIEIYGCTEAGSIASRRPAIETAWTCFDGVHLETSGAQCIASSWYFPAPIPLGDAIEVLDDQRFILQGRSTDLINIAGKRASLSALNHRLTGIQGVEDGVFFLPKINQWQTVRLHALVVAPGLEADEILECLRQQLDPAFLPRKIIKVGSLPRGDTGKLSHTSLNQLIEAVGHHGSTP